MHVNMHRFDIFTCNVSHHMMSLSMNDDYLRCGVTPSIDVQVSIFGRVRMLGIEAGVEGGLVQEGLHQIMVWISTSQMLWLRT